MDKPDYKKAGDKVYGAIECLRGILTDLQLADASQCHAARILCDGLVQLAEDIDFEAGRTAYNG